MRKDLHTLSVSCLLAFAIAGCDSADTTNRDVFESIAREPKVTIASARQLVTNGELQKAQKQCQALLLEDPENFEAARLLTSIYVREGRVDDAVETLKALSEKHPDQANKLNATVAELLFESGRSDAAISELRRLIERDPEALTYRRQLASMLNERGFRFDANEQLRFLAARQPLSIRELIGLVNPLLTWVSFSNKPDWTNKDVIERHGVLNVVLALRAAGDTREALQCLEQSSLLKLRHPAAVAIHGWLLAENQRDDELEAWVIGVESASQRYPGYWIAMGNYFLSKSTPDVARDCFVEALRREPGSMIAAAGLKQSLELAGPEEFEAVLIEYMTRLNESQNLAYKIGSSERPAGHLAKPMGAAMNAMGRPVESVAWQESLLLASPSGSEQLARKFSDLKSQLRERFQTGLDAERSPAAKLSKRLRPGFLAKSLALIERSSASGLASASERPVNQRQAAVPSFTDVARQVGIQFRYENASPILEKEFRLFEALGGGVACFDFDLDGRVDFYLGQAGLNPPAEPASDVPSNSLYRQVDQSFNDSTAVSGLATADYTLGVTAGDWNGDGFPDLFVGNVGDNRLWLNQGDGTFRFAKPIPEQGAESMVTASVAIADVNGDGIADLIEANYVDDDRVYDEIPRDESGKPIVLPGPKQFQAAPVKILETNRDGSLTAQWLGDEEGRSTGLGLLVADIDSDGRTEVFVANDQNANHLWQRSGEGNSDGASWVETATALGCGYGTSGRGMACMGIAAADFDRNGRPDLHITNFLGERSNLYLQRADRSFRDAAVRYGIDEVSVNLLGFGTQPIDYDNDGWFDLFVGNGHIEDFRDRGKSFRMRPQLLRNNGVAFQELVVDGDDPFWSSQRLSRGVAVLDWNRDGKVDVAVGDLSDRFALLENRTETTNACLQIELVGVAGDRNAIGTTIQSFDDDHRDVYMMTSGDGYLARNEAVVFIGRGPHPHEESSATLEIHWPGGLKQPLRGLQSGRYLVVEGSEPWKRW